MSCWSANDEAHGQQQDAARGASGDKNEPIRTSVSHFSCSTISPLVEHTRSCATASVNQFTQPSHNYLYFYRLMLGNELKEHWGSEMKELVAVIALLCVSNSVLAHDIYSNLRDRDGHLCCGGQDCKPVQATVLPNGSYYLPRTNEIIPADRATPSPDDRFHQCTYYPIVKSPSGDPVWESTPVTRCFFAPMHSS